jgi:hypothetical protein
VRRTFDNAYTRWYPEVSYHAPNVPIILIGLRWELSASNVRTVTTQEAIDVCKQINASAYIETSAVYASDIVNAFNVAITTGVSVVFNQNGINNTASLNKHSSENHLMKYLIGEVNYFNGNLSTTNSPSSPKSKLRHKRSFSMLPSISSIFQSRPNKILDISEIGL